MSCPRMRNRPATRTLSMRSFIRFRQRNNVDFPHPDGPMNAVTCRSGISIATS